jgi:hypothetical protein
MVSPAMAMRVRTLLAITLALAAAVVPVAAETDEIQVYDGGLATRWTVIRMPRAARRRR